MQMEAFLWLFLPLFVAGGSALLSYYVMQARMEVALAKERESLAEARAMISSHKVTLDERVKATEEACKRQALDDFMHDIRVEERSYVRETKSLNALKKTMVMQERIFFRNIPLSNWIEREMIIEDGQENAATPRGVSVHASGAADSGNALSDRQAPPRSKSSSAQVRASSECTASYRAGAAYATRNGVRRAITPPTSRPKKGGLRRNVIPGGVSPSGRV